MTVLIKYEITIKDVIEHNMWLSNRCGTFVKNRWLTTFVVSLFMGLLSYSVLCSFFRWQAALTMSAVVVAVWGIAIYFGYRKSVRQNIKKAYIQQMGNANPIPFELRIDPLGVHCQCNDTLFSSAWTRVKSIENRDGTVILWFRDNTLAVARERAFNTPAHLEEFLALAERYHRESLDAAKNSDPSV